MGKYRKCNTNNAIGSPSKIDNLGISFRVTELCVVVLAVVVVPSLAVAYMINYLFLEKFHQDFSITYIYSFNSSINIMKSSSLTSLTLSLLFHQCQSSCTWCTSLSSWPLLTTCSSS